MNTLSAESQQSEVIPKEHLALVIDGLPLDFIIAGEDENGEVNSVELVPTLLSWLKDPTERAFTWERILPAAGKKTIAPVLMCPDDCDLICTVIVAEVENKGQTVTWNKIGIDVGRTPGTPETIGKEVEWLDVPTYTFTSDNYTSVLNTFKQNLD